MIIRAKTFKDWMKANFEKSELEDICNFGVDGGFGGLIYYRDTCNLYAHFKEEIWDMAVEMAEEMGNSNVFEMIANFGGAKNVGGVDQMENLMVWFAAEEYARQLTGN